MQPLTIFYPLRDYLDSLQSFDLFRTFLVLLYLPVFHFNIIHSFYFSCFTSRHSTLHYLTLHNIWSHLLKKSLMENFSFLQCNKRPFGNKCSSWNLSSNFMSVYRKISVSTGNFSKGQLVPTLNFPKTKRVDFRP